MHKWVKAYLQGKQAFPNEPNPYRHDTTTARMWRLGWQYTRDQQAGTPNPPTTELDDTDP